MSVFQKTIFNNEDQQSILFMPVFEKTICNNEDHQYIFMSVSENNL